MPAVFISDPPNGTVLDYSKKLTVRWDSDPKGAVKSWKLYLGTEDGRWDLLMCEQGAVKQIDLDPHDLPLGGRLFAQVRGTYDGKSRPEPGKPPEDIEERVVSNIVQWICPDATQAPPPPRGLKVG
ncbi:hypothetical protein ACO9S2_12370 [Nitrospira sp. NS4]|uniref:hypothetical protein n=1 Tax=Nitrospira sp. NS4 TaxID=3414498 RepID=UPI003C30A62F